MTEDSPGELSRIWNALRDGATRRKSPFHTFTLATVAPDGTPDARAIILRGADAGVRRIIFHGDARSPKLQQMRQQAAVVAVFYSEEDRLQIRLRGRAEIHHNDEIAAETWGKMQRMSRECYRTPHAPGATLAENAPAEPLTLEDARRNFAVILVRCDDIEWLSLSAAGHRRARVRYFSDGTALTERLAP